MRWAWQKAMARVWEDREKPNWGKALKPTTDRMKRYELERIKRIRKFWAIVDSKSNKHFAYGSMSASQV